MNSFEKKLLAKVDEYFPALVVLAVSLLGFLVRFSLRGIISVDAQDYLLPWYKAIAENGLYEPVGNYNLLYQFLIWVMTKLPLSDLLAYKSLSCGFDYLLALVAALLVSRLSGPNRIWPSIWAYSAVLLSPVTFINSAAWAQCDSIFVCFALLGIYFLEKDSYNLSLIALGISFAFKLQAVFVLPVYLLVYFIRRRFSLLRFVLVPISMLVVSFPAVFWGRSLLECFSIYFDQTSTYHMMSANYPSFWSLICYPNYAPQYDALKSAAVIFTVCVLLVIMVWWVRSKYDTRGINLIALTFILSFACVLFLPAMHDRYGYIYEICAIMLAVLIPKTIPLCLGLLLMSSHTYGIFLFEITSNFKVLAVLNIAVFLGYIHVLRGYLRKTEES